MKFYDLYYSRNQIKLLLWSSLFQIPELNFILRLLPIENKKSLLPFMNASCGHMQIIPQILEVERGQLTMFIFSAFFSKPFP